MLGKFSHNAPTWLRLSSFSLTLLLTAALANAQFAPVLRFGPQDNSAPNSTYTPAPNYYPPAYYAPPTPVSSPRYYYPLTSSAPSYSPNFYAPRPDSASGFPPASAPTNVEPRYLNSPPPASRPSVPPDSQLSTGLQVAEQETKRPSLWDTILAPDPAISQPPSPKERFWVGAEYLAAFMRPMRLSSPLVTTGSSTDAHPGALGQPDTAVLFGNNSVDYGLISGGRLEAGVFLDEARRFSLQWTGFLLAPRSQTFTAASDSAGNLLLTRPVFATDVNDERSFVTSFPGQFAGAIAVETKSLLGGTELNLRWNRCISDSIRAEALIGFRYLRLAESLQIRENVNAINGNTFFLPPNNVAYTTFSDQDSFATTNQFFGPQVGGQVAWGNRWIDASAFAKLGLGATVQHVNIDGSTTFVLPGGNQTLKGGVLALSSNIGSYNRTAFGLVPEFGFVAGANLTENLRVTIGYSILVWNRVVRPGMQYDHDVNTLLTPSGNFTPGNVTGSISPKFRFNDELFFVNNFTLGIEYRF